MTRGVVKCLKCWTHLAQLLSIMVPFLLFEVLIMERLVFFLCSKFIFALPFFWCKEPEVPRDDYWYLHSFNQIIVCLSSCWSTGGGFSVLFLEDIVSCLPLDIVDHLMRIVDQLKVQGFCQFWACFFESNVKRIQNIGGGLCCSTVLSSYFFWTKA
jgi:hypothetical protein